VCSILPDWLRQVGNDGNIGATLQNKKNVFARSSGALAVAVNLAESSGTKRNFAELGGRLSG
jgi:hypothetical protein